VHTIKNRRGSNKGEILDLLGEGDPGLSNIWESERAHCVLILMKIVSE